MFGITNLNISVLTGKIVQSGSATQQADKEMVRNGDGDRVAEVYYDRNETLTVEVVQASANANSIANAISEFLYINPGTVANVTASDMGNVVANNWIVDSCTLSQSNTTAGKLTVNLHRSAGITGAMS